MKLSGLLAAGAALLLLPPASSAGRLGKAGLGSMQSLADSLPRSQLHLCGRVCHLHHKDSVLAGNPPEGCDAGREEPWTDEGADDAVVEPISPQRLRGGGDVAIPDGGVAAMRMADLQKALRERNLTTRGGKADLVVRLQEALDRDRAGGGGMNKRSMSPTADAKKQKVAYKKLKKHKGPIETKQGIELLKGIKDASTSDEIYEIFSSQADAFRFADARPGFRLQVFSEDIAATGAKHYVVATYAGFWRMYKRLPAGSKHFGEVIREGNACRLYFDLEFPIEKGDDVAAAHSTGNERVDAMVAALAPALQERFGIQAPPSIVELDSSTDTKFSRHLIVHNVVFRDTRHCGAFVKYFAEELLPVDISQCVDLGVYTRNRCFRIIDSSKYGKAATFKLSRRESMQHGWDPVTDTNPLMRMMYLSSRPSQGGVAAPEKNIFLHSLICYTADTATALEDPAAVLAKPSQPQEAASSDRNLTSSGPRPLYAGQHGSTDVSPFPELDKYVCNVARPGAQIVKWTFYRALGRISYFLTRNRFCENIDRFHRSNNVIIDCDLAKGFWQQACLDQDCVAERYRSKARALPRGIFEARLLIELDPLLSPSPPPPAGTDANREDARKKLTLTHEAFAALGSGGVVIPVAERRKAMKEGILVEASKTHVTLNNCQELWGEVKSLGFEYDLGRKRWEMPLSEAASLIASSGGEHPPHEGPCDEACAPREAILSLIEREFFASSRPQRTPSPDLQSRHPPVEYAFEGGVWTARGGGGVVLQSRLRTLGFEWDAGLAALTLPEEAAKNLTGSSEITAESIAALVANTSATSVIVTRHNVVVKDAAHSKDVMERAGFAWDVKLQGWHMPCAAALRFLRAHSITDANPEAVYEGLEACAGDGFTRGDTSPPPSRGLSSASSSPPESRAAADEQSMSSHGELPFDKSSGRVGGGVGSSIDWAGSTVKLVEDSVMVEGAGRRERECLRKFLGFRWNEDVKAMVRSSNEVMPLLGIDFESGVVDCEVGARDMTPEAIKAMFGRASSALQGHEGGLFSSSRMYLQFDREGMVLVKNSYEEKDLLKAAGFRWNVENKCWTMPQHDLERELEGEVTAQRLLDALPRLAENGVGGVGGGGGAAGGMSGGGEPSVEIEDGGVFVHNSYSIKDSLRALRFRWDADRRCWGSDLESVVACLGTDAITIDALVEAGARALSGDSKAAAPSKSRGQYGGAYAVVEDDVVSVFNSYDIKDELRDRFFRWNAEQRTWCCSVSELLALGMDPDARVDIEAIMNIPVGKPGKAV